MAGPSVGPRRDHLGLARPGAAGTCIPDEPPGWGPGPDAGGGGAPHRRADQAAVGRPGPGGGEAPPRRRGLAGLRGEPGPAAPLPGYAPAGLRAAGCLRGPARRHAPPGARGGRGPDGLPGQGAAGPSRFPGGGRPGQGPGRALGLREAGPAGRRGALHRLRVPRLPRLRRAAGSGGTPRRLPGPGGLPRRRARDVPLHVRGQPHRQPGRGDLRRALLQGRGAALRPGPVHDPPGPGHGVPVRRPAHAPGGGRQAVDPGGGLHAASHGRLHRPAAHGGHRRRRGEPPGLRADPLPGLRPLEAGRGDPPASGKRGPLPVGGGDGILRDLHLIPTASST